MKKEELDFLEKRKKLKEEVEKLKREKPWLETSPLMESVIDGAILVYRNKKKEEIKK